MLLNVWRFLDAVEISPLKYVVSRTVSTVLKQ